MPAPEKPKKIFKQQNLNAILEDEVVVPVKIAAKIIGCDRTAVYELIKESYLTAHCPNGPGKRPMKIFTVSIKKYLKSFAIGAPLEK